MDGLFFSVCGKKGAGAYAGNLIARQLWA